MSDSGYENAANNIWKWPMLIVLVLGALGAGGFILYQQNAGGRNIRGFEDCVKAGNLVMESYPQQCTADGRTYINTNFDANKINNIKDN